MNQNNGNEDGLAKIKEKFNELILRKDQLKIMLEDIEGKIIKVETLINDYGN